jgi:hypothetical protein
MNMSLSSPSAPTRPHLAAPTVRVHLAAPTIRVHLAAPIVRVHPATPMVRVHPLPRPVRAHWQEGWVGNWIKVRKFARLLDIFYIHGREKGMNNVTKPIVAIQNGAKQHTPSIFCPVSTIKHTDGVCVLLEFSCQCFWCTSQHKRSSLGSESLSLNIE